MKTKNKNKVTKIKLENVINKKMLEKFNKSKKNVKPSKTIKPVGKEIKTSSFGSLFYGNNIEKDIITKANNLMNAITGIKKKQIPELALALKPYMVELGTKKIKPTMAEVKKYVFNLVGYKTVTKEGLITKNESFESNVARAVKVAFLMNNKKTGFDINSKLEIVAPSNILYPMTNNFTPKGKKLKPTKNTDPTKIKANISEIEKIFQEKILGQKSNNNKKSPTPKDTKVKEVLIDTKIKDVKNYLLGLNSMGLEAFTQSNFKGSLKDNLTEIVKLFSILVAKNKTIITDESGKNTCNNNVLFNAKYQQQLNWATTHLRNAVINISEEPKLKVSLKNSLNLALNK